MLLPYLVSLLVPSLLALKSFPNPERGEVELSRTVKHQPVSLHDQTLTAEEAADVQEWFPLQHWEYGANSSIKRHRRQSSLSRYPMGLRTLQFIHNKTRYVNLDAHFKQWKGFNSRLGFVTHAGKENLEYIDGAVMLGRSLAKHAPQYPRYAIAVEGMSEENKKLLSDAGWFVVVVEDWGAEHCGNNCAGQFLGRWGDSFEKLNVFRFPLRNAIFLDADTFVFSDDIIKIFTSTALEKGQIAMVRDMCKVANDSTEFNSGMILLQPDLTEYARMLELIALHSAGDVKVIGDILDQGIINEEYRGRVVELLPKYNCIDLARSTKSGRCQPKCHEDMVVAHFTAMPKVTRAAEGFTVIVRDTNRTNADDKCSKTNHGCCYRYSEFYCELVANRQHVSEPLQAVIDKVGPCWPQPPQPPPNPLGDYRMSAVRMPYDRIPPGSGAAGDRATGPSRPN